MGTKKNQTAKGKRELSERELHLIFYKTWHRTDNVFRRLVELPVPSMVKPII